jgi:hypothetical protein
LRTGYNRHMTESKLTKLILKNFLASAIGMAGSGMFRHIYVRDESGREFDAAEDGSLSCAYAVSGLLCMYRLIDQPHSTVATVLKKMQESGWQETDTSRPGAVAYWPEYEGHEHIGIVVSDTECISNSTSERVPVRHGLTMVNGLRPTKFYTHPNLTNET